MNGDSSFGIDHLIISDRNTQEIRVGNEKASVNVQLCVLIRSLSKPTLVSTHGGNVCLTTCSRKVTGRPHRTLKDIRASNSSIYTLLLFRNSKATLKTHQSFCIAIRSIDRGIAFPAPSEIVSSKLCALIGL